MTPTLTRRSAQVVVLVGLFSVAAALLQFDAVASLAGPSAAEVAQLPRVVITSQRDAEPTAAVKPDAVRAL